MVSSVTCTLADAPLEIIDGDRGTNYPKQADFLKVGHCLFLNAGNVTTDGFSFSDCSFITDNKDRMLRKGKLARCDVVLTTRGTVGNVAFYNSGVPYEHVRINSGMVIFRANNKKLLPQYLHLFLRSSIFQDQVKALSTGSAQPQLPIRDIQKIEISIPSLPEQYKVATTLGALDEKIKLNRDMNKTIESIAQAIFKRWFVDFEFPDNNGKSYKSSGGRMIDSKLGEIPEGWIAGILADVAENPRRSIQPNEVEPFTPYIALKHMPKRSIALSEWDTAAELDSNKFEFKKGEILFRKLRPYFHKVGIAPIDGVCSTDIVVVTPRNSAWLGFVLGHVSSRVFVEYANAGSTGTRMPRTNWKDMSRYLVAIPPENLTEDFNSQVRPAIEKIIESVHESRAISTTRDYLLPKLMSGKIRIEDKQSKEETYELS